MSCLRLFVLLIATVATARAALPETIAGYHTVALGRGAQSHLFMAVEIAGKEALLGVDTGAPMTVFDRRKAKRYGVKRAGFAEDEPPAMIMLGTEMAPIGLLPKLTARGFEFGSGPVVLANLSAIARISAGMPGKSRPVDGILGVDVLRTYEAVIDCETSRVYFREAAKARMAVPRGYVRIPMQLNDGRHFTVPCVVHGERRRLLVDTGSFGTLFDTKRAAQIGLRGVKTRYTSSSGLTDNPKPMLEVQVADLKVGRQRIAQPSFGATDLEPLLFAGEPDLIGILGNDVLTGQGAIIDFGNLNLYLRRP